MSDSHGERSAAWSAAGGVVVLLGVGAAIPLWLLAKNSKWELVLAILSTVAICLGLYWMIAALIPLWPFSRANSSEMKFRLERRRQFARHIQNQLQQLAGQENWHDERFADLEAEVEVEGRQRRIPWLRHSRSRTVILRREKSLSRALERSAEPLIVLEGDPGAGKSVALRHLAEQLADRARRSPETCIIPLYVNLKEFHPERRPVDSSSVRDFIFASIVRVNDRDVERFMDEEFDRGLIAGSWILLLDSFDEIPDILSSTEADNAVEEYALAIHNFLFGMRKSRAIVASREFRGPKTFREPRFQIVALSGRRQADLIRRSGLHPDQVRTVEGGLAIADSEIRQSATNPMFLGLICEYVQATGRFPGSSYSVYESYLTQRLSRDAERIQKRYKVSVQLVRALAEEIAFSMAAELGLGLSPTRKALRSALIRTDYIPIARLDAVLNALEYIKLGRAGENTGGSGEPSFTFAHRRFQEYFATCVVIRNPERVSVAELLVDGRWRETAVTIMQTQPMTAITPLLEEATRAIAPMTRKAIEDEERQTATGGYCWPPGAMHLLAVLSAGLGQTPENIPSEFRADAGSLLMSAWNKGRRYDKKWALSFALVARKDDTIWLLDEAFASGSLVLGGEAYLCVSRLADPPLSLYEGVRKTLVEMAASGDLTEQKVALNAQVRRLPGPRPLIRTLRLLSLAPKIDYALAAIQVLICAVILWPSAIAEIILVTIGLMGYRRMLFTQTVYRLWGTNLIIRPNSWIFSATVIYARLSAPVFPIVVAFAVPPRSPLIVVVACIAGTYFAGWPAEVGYVCKHRRSTSEFSWPLIPIFALVGVLRRLVIIIRQASMPKLLRTALPVVLFYGILIWAGVAYVPSLVTSRNGSLALKFIAIGLAVVGGIAACCLIAFYLYRRYYEARLIRSIANGRQWSIVEIFIILGRVQTPRGMRLLIELLLQIDFVAHPEILRLLSDIAAAAEVSDEKSEAQKKNAEAMVIPGVTAEFSEWIKGSHAEPTLLDWLLNLEWIFSRKARLSLPYSIRNVQKPMLDQIARAVEQVEIARGFTVS